jgi:hypothetical protein
MLVLVTQVSTRHRISKKIILNWARALKISPAPAKAERRLKISVLWSANLLASSARPGLDFMSVNFSCFCTAVLLSTCTAVLRLTRDKMVCERDRKSPSLLTAYVAVMTVNQDCF